MNKLMLALCALTPSADQVEDLQDLLGFVQANPRRVALRDLFNDKPEAQNLHVVLDVVAVDPANRIPPILSLLGILQQAEATSQAIASGKVPATLASVPAADAPAQGSSSAPVQGSAPASGSGSSSSPASESGSSSAPASGSGSSSSPASESGSSSAPASGSGSSSSPASGSASATCATCKDTPGLTADGQLCPTCNGKPSAVPAAQ